MDHSCHLNSDMTILQARSLVERCVPVGATERTAKQFLRRNHLDYRTEDDGRRVIAIISKPGVPEIRGSITVEFSLKHRVSYRAVNPFVQLP